MSGQSFDRVRARRAQDGAGSAPGAGSPVDTQGKAALFSREAVTPSLGHVVITCGGCHAATVVSYLRAVQLAIPSVHLPLLRRDHPSWMRCPACQRRTWVHVRLI